MADRRPSGEHAKRCREIARVLIPALRHRARACGYSIGVHGSLSYDIDLIACPWVHHAVEPRVLAEALREVVKAVCCFAEQPDIDNAVSSDNERHAERLRNGNPGGKPHGRLCWTFHVGGGPYVDLSVMPRIEEKPSATD